MRDQAINYLKQAIGTWIARLGVVGAQAVGTLIGASVVVAGAGAVASAQAEEPMAFMKARQREVESILVSTSGAARDAALIALLESHMDFDDFAHRSLGYQWGRLTATQKSQYRALLKELMERVHIRKLSEDVPRYKLTWNDAATNDDRARISFVIRREDMETEVDFDLRQAGDSWVVLDVSYDGLSAAANYQKKYGKVLREEGFDALALMMKRRLEELK